MNQSLALASKIMYPLTALITVNLKFVLFRRKVMFPAIIAFIPVIPILFFRVMMFIYGEFPRNNDPVTFFSIVSASVYMQFVVPFLALMRGMSIMSEEVEDGTIVFLRLRPVPRTIIVLGKFLAYVLSTVILVGLSLFTTYFLLSSLPNANMFFYELPLLWEDMRVFILGLAAYGAIMMVIGIIFKRPLLFGAFFLFIWDTFASFIPGTAHKLTIKHYLQSIFSNEMRDALPSKNLLEALLSQHTPEDFTRAVITLLSVVAVCIALTVLSLIYKEFKTTQQETG